MNSCRLSSDHHMCVCHSMVWCKSKILALGRQRLEDDSNFEASLVCYMVSIRLTTGLHSKIKSHNTTQLHIVSIRRSHNRRIKASIHPHQTEGHTQEVFQQSKGLGSSQHLKTLASGFPQQWGQAAEEDATKIQAIVPGLQSPVLPSPYLPYISHPQTAATQSEGIPQLLWQQQRTRDSPCKS